MFSRSQSTSSKTASRRGSAPTEAPVLFANREHAGQLLAAQLGGHRALDPIVIGLARGGVPVAAVVAETIGAPVGVLNALRLAVPGEPERAAGAVAPGVRFILDDVVRELEISD